MKRLILALIFFVSIFELQSNDGTKAPPNNGVLLVSATDSRKTFTPKHITEIGPAPFLGDPHWKPEWISFELESGKVFKQMQLTVFDAESRLRILDLAKERKILTGSLVGGGFARNNEELDLSVFKDREDIVALECTPFDVFAILASGEILGSKTGKLKGPDGEVISGVRTAIKQGNGSLMIYDKAGNFHMWRNGAETTEIIDTGRLEREDHFGSHEMTFVRSGERYELGLGHFRIKEGKLIYNPERQYLPEGTTASLDSSTVSFDRGADQAVCMSTNECGQVWVAYQRPNGGERYTVLYATEVGDIQQETSSESDDGETPAGRHISLRMIEQQIRRNNRYFVGKPPVDIDNIEKMIPGGTDGMYALTYPDRIGNRALICTGGGVRSGGRPGESDDLRLGRHVGTAVFEGGRAADLVPNTIVIGGNMTSGMRSNGQGFGSGPIQGTFSEEQQAMFREVDIKTKITADFGVDGFMLRQRQDGPDDGTGATIYVGLEKTGELRREKVADHLK